MAQVAIITGAGRGIGRACAHELAQKGYGIVAVARTQSDLDETCRTIPDSLVIVADITDPAVAEQIVKKTIGRFGRLDTIVNSAGLAPALPIEQTSVETWHSVIDTNLSAVFYLCKAAWPIFRKQKSGVIVNISSLAARDPFPGFAAYGAAKAGLNLLGLSLAREGDPHNIRVHTIAPAAVETAMFRKLMDEAQYGRDKTLDPADIARVVAQCVAGDLRYTSGEVIYVRKSL